MKVVVQGLAVGEAQQGLLLANLLVLDQSPVDEGSQKCPHVLSTLQAFDGCHGLSTRSRPADPFARLAPPLQQAGLAGGTFQDRTVGEQDEVAELGGHLERASLWFAGAILAVEPLDGSLGNLFRRQSEPVLSFLELGIGPRSVVVDQEGGVVQAHRAQVDAVVPELLGPCRELAQTLHLR